MAATKHTKNTDGPLQVWFGLLWKDGRLTGRGPAVFVKTKGLF